MTSSSSSVWHHHPHPYDNIIISHPCGYGQAKSKPQAVSFPQMCTQIRTSRCWVNAHCAYINNFTGQLFTYFLPVYLNRECVDGFLCFAVLVCVCPESVCNQVLLHYPIQNDNNNLYESQWSLSLSVALDMYDLDGLCTDTLSGATTGTATVRSRSLTFSASIQSLGWRRQCSAQGRVVLSGKYTYETKTQCSATK